jgi:hypothetical protein
MYAPSRARSDVIKSPSIVMPALVAFVEGIHVFLAVCQ